ncbi:MAG: hypothetical protein KKF12_16730 [Proteobacteria bacterium]|nr:hypothetical protein [Desulfobacula sp.]MBU3954603.1 hypothetical protein [Pseudomonadota bacterium]MBU4132462.1 hypothetical protein [Pseudomonadota bacterium]
MKSKSISITPRILPIEAEESIKALLEKLKKEYPCGVPRKYIGKATGGMYHPRTQANRDSLGSGIPGRFKHRGQTIYPVKGIISDVRANLSA